MGLNKTLATENQLIVNCPVFPTKSRIAACFVLRDLVWRGDGPPDKRAGCQAAMTCGKCPIDRLVKRMVRTGEDKYHSTEQTVRDFDDELLDATGKVLITDKTLNSYALSAAEQKYLLQHNEDAKNYVSKATKPSRSLRAQAMELDHVERPATPAKTDAAAIVGGSDMAAAINAEINSTQKETQS